jgi:hypothetical protein
VTNTWICPVQNCRMITSVLSLLHISMDTRHGETLVNVLSQPIHFTTSVAEDHGSSDPQRMVQVTRRFKLVD